MLKKFFIIFITIMCFMSTEVSYADESSFGFSSKLLPIEQKVDDSVSDYKLKVSPNEEITLPVKIKNETDNPMNILAEVKNSHTNSDGSLNYTSDENNLNSHISLKNIVKYKEMLKLEANEEKIINIKFKVPNEKFNGIILGGLNLKKIDLDNKMMIKNSFSYSYPILLVEDENATPAKLEFGDIHPELLSGKNTIKITLNNINNNLLNEASYSVAIKKKGTKKIIFKDRIKNVEFAPNAAFEHFVFMDKENYVSGDYTACVTVKSPYGDWNWNKDFYISKKKASELNRKSVNVGNRYKIPIPMWIVVILMFMCILVLLIKNKRLK